MVGSKALDKPTKMAQPVAIPRRPRSISRSEVQGHFRSLSKSTPSLQDRFGQLFKILRACVDTLVKGPAIAPQDKKDLQCYTDMVQVMYDMLEAMNCLGEMNTDNLEKMILRLPKWAATITNIQLHYFSDASNHGYASVSFLRFVDD